MVSLQLCNNLVTLSIGSIFWLELISMIFLGLIRFKFHVKLSLLLQGGYLNTSNLTNALTLNVVVIDGFTKVLSSLHHRNNTNPE